MRPISYVGILSRLPEIEMKEINFSNARLRFNTLGFKNPPSAQHTAVYLELIFMGIQSSCISELLTYSTKWAAAELELSAVSMFTVSGNSLRAEVNFVSAVTKPSRAAPWPSFPPV